MDKLKSLGHTARDCKVSRDVHPEASAQDVRECIKKQEEERLD